MADNNHSTLRSLFSDIANSIRRKTEWTNNIIADTFPEAIDKINWDATISSGSQLMNGVIAYGNNGKYVGSIQSKTENDLVVNGPNVTVPAGYYGNNATASVATTTHPDPTVGYNLSNINNGIVAINASHTQNTGYVIGNTTSAITNVNIGIATINNPSGSKTLNKPNIELNKSTGVVTTSSESVNVTAYANTTNNGYTTNKTRSGNVVITGNTNTLNIGLSNPTASTVIVNGSTVSGYVSGNDGYTNSFNIPITGTVSNGALVSSVTSHTNTNPSVTVSHSGNISTIGTTTKPSGTAGTDYYQIGFSNSVINGNTNARAYGNVSTNGYVTTANNTASSWSNKVIGASVTQPATYYVNKGTLAQSNISGAAFLENAGDYGFRATVVVPEGYHTGETVTKDFTTGIFPAPESKANSNQMLTGYSLYDEDGRLITGSMPNQGAQNSTISTQGGTYTIPEGYHDGNGVVTASLPSASINTIAGSKAQSKPTFSIDSSTGIVTASVAATSGIAYGNVTNSGYVPSGTRSGTFSMTASSNTYAVPNGYIRTIGAISVYNNDGIKFAEGPINARDLSLKADSEIVRSINGYINSNYIVNDFDSYHFYINNQTISSTSITPYTNGVSQIVTVSEGYRDSDATITVAGVAAGAYSATQVTAVGVTPNVSGTITSIATTTAPTGTDGVDYFTINPEASVTNGNARARINTAGYLAAGNKYVNITGSVGAGTNYYITTGSFDSGVVPYPSNGNAYVNVNVVVTPLVAINANSGLITVTGTQRPNGSILNANTIPVGMTSGWIDNSAFTNLTVRAFSGGPGLNNLQLTTKSGDGSNYQNNLTITPTASDQVVMNRNEFLVANHIIVKSASSGPKGALSASGVATAPKPSFSINSSIGVVTATVAGFTGTSYANVSTVGYVDTSNNKTGTVTGTGNSNTYTVPNGYIHTIGSISVYENSGIKFAEGPTNARELRLKADSEFVQNVNGYINSAYLRNDFDTYSYYINNQTISATTVTPSTSAQTVTVSEGYRDAAATITVSAMGAGTLAAGSAAVLNNSNGNIRYYRNVSKAGYLATNTTAYYLQLNTKAGSTTTVTSTGETTLVNAGQFVTGAIKVKGGSGAFKDVVDGQGAVISGPVSEVTRWNDGVYNLYEISSDQNNTMVSWGSGSGIQAISTNGILTTSSNFLGVMENIKSSVSVAETSITTTVSGTISRAPVLRFGGVPSGTVNAAGGAITTTAPTSGPYITVNTPANTATATATISTVTEGFTDGTNYGKTQGTKTAGAAAMSNRYIPIKVGTIDTPSGSLTISKPGMAFNATTGIVTGTVSAVNGTVYRNVTDAGWLDANTTSGTFVITGNSNTINIGLSTLTAQANSVTVSGKTVTYNINAVTTAGYKSAETKWVNGTKSVADGTLLAGTASVLNNANGNIRYYRNVDQAGYLARNTTAYYLQLNTKAGATYTNITTTAVTVINAGQFATGAIKVSAPAGTLAAGSAAVLNNSNGNIRYYRNVSTAGYIAANTTAYYLQLNTKGGSTTYVNGTGATLVNAGQFVTGAIIAKAANCTYDSTNTRLIIPTGLVTT